MKNEIKIYLAAPRGFCAGVDRAIEIVKKALEAPIRQITSNAGVDGSVVVGKLLESKKMTQGYDAQNEEYVDMFSKGIIDPTKVVRSALQDAASIAGLLITTEAMIADKPEDKDSGPAMPPGGMGGMGGAPGGMGGGPSGPGGPGGPSGPGGMGDMFGPQGKAKLMANPRIAKYFQDP